MASMKKIEQPPSTIAIIGMGCIFPKSPNLKAFWHLLFNGTDAIENIPDKTHWNLEDYFDQDPSTPDHTYCTRGGFIPEVAFDPLDYGIPPNNLTATDTSQLLGLEVARMALEDAGYPVSHPDLATQRVNVILGVTGTQELVIPLGARLGHPIWKRALEDSGIDPQKKAEIIQRIQDAYVPWQENSFPGLLGNVVAGRIANRLNLSGTNSVSDAACASSLAAVHTAVMELQSHRCDMSITGGVDTLNDIFMHMCFSKTGVLSHTSDARPFSQDADGTVLGEGIGMLVLKRLEDARRDQDRIYALIKGMGTSSDGKTSAIYAPEAKGQLKALNQAYELAEISPSTVELVEAHGTGTRVGDKVEFSALKACFHPPGNPPGPALPTIAIGSVKSMIGHTKAAAGAAGIIKAALALYNKVIPPTLKATIPDPELEINGSAFYLNGLSKPWLPHPDKIHPRRSGVSAFGFGGSNFHAVLEEYDPIKSHVSWDGSVQIFAFSAHQKSALLEKIHKVQQQVSAYADLNSDESSHPYSESGEMNHAIAWQAHESRQAFCATDELRLLFVFKKNDDFFALVDKALDAVNHETITQGPLFFSPGKPEETLGFLFPGQGSQYPDMAKDLSSLFPEAMEALDLAQSCFKRENRDTPCPPLNDYIFPLPPHVQPRTQSEENLRQTQIAQPALGAVCLAYTDILKRFKVIPHMTCGHSFGELSALYAAGWLDRHTFLQLAAARGKYMAAARKEKGDSGSMLAVQAPLKEIKALIREHGLDLVLANQNSPVQGVLSGSTEEIDKAKKLCGQKKMRAVKLPVAAAFHSPLVQEAAAPFKQFIADKQVSPTGIDVLSNTTGFPYPTEPEAIKDILGNQLMHPVHFIDNIQQMFQKGVSTFVEVGPKTILTGLVKTILKDKNITALSLDASSGKNPGLQDLAHLLCTLAARGFFVDLTAWEEPAAPPRVKKMKIMLSGANPKPAPKPKPSPKSEVPAPDPSRVQPHRLREKTQKAEKAETAAPITRDNPTQFGSDMTLSRPIQPSQPIQASQPGQPISAAPGSEAMHLVQKGLEAMQQLQTQTARAHEKFLETQTQASKTLASMMEQTREFIAFRPGTSKLFQTSAGHAVSASALIQPPSDPPSRPVQQPLQASDPPRIMGAPKQARPSTHPITGVKRDTKSEPPVPARTPADPHRASVAVPLDSSVPDMPLQPTLPVQEILFDIVSRLTGFPGEMLEPEMEIESDLGIDSIKKVEIISELEKHFPESEGFTTDLMGSVKTLKDICHALQPPEPDGVCKTPLAAPEPNDKIFTILVKTISDLTGFPGEMLEKEMNLESDLGIDSIKRVEILSRLEQELADVNALSSDDMAGLKTIQDIVDFLGTGNPVPEPPSPPPKTSVTYGDEDLKPSQPESVRLSRQEITLKKFPTNQIRFYNGAKIELSDQKTVYLTRDRSKIAAHFKQEFENIGISAKLIDISQGKIPRLPDAAGIVIIPDSFENPDSQVAKDFLKSAFCLAQKNAPYLIASGSEKGAFLATISFLGGGFAFNTPLFSSNPIYGGLAGLVKTADLEWKKVLCRALDMPDSIERCIEMAEAAVSLMMTQGAIEMGLDGDNCNIPMLETRDTLEGVVNLGPEDVVIMTGGAKGVTAECAVQLAHTCSPNIILVGRSVEPFQEPDWIQEIFDPAAMKKQILRHEFRDQKPTPSDIESRYQALVSNREIQTTMARIKANGSSVKYLCADIRDPQDMDRVFAWARREFNLISAIIHGAGVLEDKLIQDKHLDQFTRVFDTKVQGLEILMAATRQDSLKYFVLFSSIAARTGNMGQSDYAMANEVLNKVAQKLAVEKPDCRCLSINWGPWAGGMVDDALKREFGKRNIALIPLDLGAEQLIREMGNPDTQAIEVVIGGPPAPDKPVKEPVLTLALKQSFGPKASPIILAHKIAQEPVVPFALLIELMAHAAKKNNPGLVFAGMDQMRLLKGIRPQDSEIQVEVHLGKCTPGESGFRVLGNLTSQDSSGRSLNHASAMVLLEDRLPQPPVLSKAAFMDLGPCRLSVDQAYETVLFHNKPLQSITAIPGISAKGIEVMTRRGPRPETWLKHPHSKDWAIDPLMLDAAFQAAILWSHEIRNEVCLPSFMENIRLYASQGKPTGTIRILFTVNQQSRHKIKGYFTFLDETQSVVASITGFEAIVDPSLNEKFKNKPLFSRRQILAFAQGNPSEAFGEKYKIFDQEREIARLPRPPYFFMDRVVKADHPQWDMKPGGWIETQYDIPADAWYFAANRTQTLPFCILLEIALQPCGWLAAYAGSALQSKERLYFRNLGGKARVVQAISRDSGTLTIQSRMTDVSKAGGMIIQDFEIQVKCQGNCVYEGTTNFGFFTRDSLAKQVGIRNSQLNAPIPSNPGGSPHLFAEESPLTPLDQTTSPDIGMPSKALRMIDQIELMDFETGLYGKGVIKGIKKVDPREWFFDAHFYQDPVCPGSLGVESFLQLLRFFLVKKFDIPLDAYTLQMTPHHAHEWIYRGQIIPTHQTIEVQAHIKDISVSSNRYTLTADGALSVDNICIYEMKNFSVEFVSLSQVIDQTLVEEIQEGER